MGTNPIKRRRRLPQTDVKTDHAGTGDGEDHLSQLPDEIICKILSESQLTLFDAYRTSVLSRRWAKLWLFRYIGPNLIFSNDYMPPRKHLKKINRKLVDRQRHMFTALLNKVLMSYQQPVVDEFVINFYFDSNFSGFIDEWISFAFSKGVKRLQLDLSPGLSFQEWETPYDFPSTLPSGIHNLRDVCLKHMYIDQQSVDALLSACPLLENLSLQPENVRKLKIEGGPTLKLKHLELDVPCFHKQILISAPNLVSLSFSGIVSYLHLLKVPLLSEFRVSDFDWKSFLEKIDPDQFSYLFQLKILKLHFSLSMLLFSRSYPLSLTEFPKLEQLEVTVEGVHIFSFLWLTVLIKAAPMLHRFSVKSMVWQLTDDMSLVEREDMEKPRHSKRDRRRIKEATKFCHQSLRLVEMSDFKGLSCEIELLQHLFDIGAQSLEKVVIDTRRSFVEQDKADSVRKLARSIGEGLGSLVEFVVI